MHLHTLRLRLGVHFHHKGPLKTADLRAFFFQCLHCVHNVYCTICNEVRFDRVRPSIGETHSSLLRKTAAALVRQRDGNISHNRIRIYVSYCWSDQLTDFRVTPDRWPFRGYCWFESALNRSLESIGPSVYISRILCLSRTFLRIIKRRFSSDDLFILNTRLSLIAEEGFLEIGINHARFCYPTLGYKIGFS